MAENASLFIAQYDHSTLGNWPIFLKMVKTSRPSPPRRFHRRHDAHRFHAHCGHAQQQVDDLFLAIGKAAGVGLLADGRVLGLFILVLVENSQCLAPLLG